MSVAQQLTLFSDPSTPYAGTTVVVKRLADRDVRTPVSGRMSELARPDMVRVSPDKDCWVPKPGAQVPQLTVCRWSKSGEGFKPVPVGGKWVRLSAGLCAELGFRDVSRWRKHETMMRLYRAGFIDMVQPSPGVWLLDIDSWFRHLKNCAENPDIWEDGSEDRETYLQKNALGGWKRGKP